MSAPARPGDGKTVLITGASGGIGYQLAICFARDGFGLILVSRVQAALERVAAELAQAYGVAVTVLAADLGQPGSAERLYAEVCRRRLGVDVLVNNAGVTMHGPFLELDPQKELEMLQLDLISLTQLTRLFLPEMLARRSGRVMNLASTAALQPGPYMAAYYAAKEYVLSFSEALGYELRKSGVTVTALCPGPTKTGFQARGKIEGTVLFQWGGMPADRVARIGYRGLMRGRPVVVAGVLNTILVFMVRLFPRRGATAISGWLASNKNRPHRPQAG